MIRISTAMIMCIVLLLQGCSSDPTAADGHAQLARNELLAVEFLNALDDPVIRLDASEVPGACGLGCRSGDCVLLSAMHTMTGVSQGDVAAAANAIGADLGEWQPVSNSQAIYSGVTRGDGAFRIRLDEPTSTLTVWAESPCFARES